MSFTFLGKKILTLATSFGAAQLVLIVSTPFLTRFYNPEVFAYFGYVVSFTIVFLPLASLHYEYAIPLAKTKKMTALLMKLCTRLLFGTSTIIFLIFFILNRYFHFLQINFFITSICLGIFLLQGVLQIYTLRLIAAGNTFYIASGKLIQNVSMILLQLLLASLGKNIAESLLFGLLVGLLLNLLYFKSSPLIATSENHIKITKKLFDFLIKRYYKFPIFSSWASFIGATSTSIPIFLIGPLYGTKALGLYYLVFRAFTAPTGLLINAVSQVMMKEFADRIKTNKKILSIFLKLSSTLAILGIGYFILLNILSHYTGIIFGNAWSGTAPIIKLLAPIIALMLCVSPVSTLFLMLNRNGLDSLWQLSYLILTIGLIYFCKSLGFLSMLSYLSMLWIVLYLLYWLMLLKIILFRDSTLCVASLA